MVQEEKLKEAKRLYQTANADQKYVLESLFPELKESEDDESTRKRIIALVNAHGQGRFKESMLVWLEKQGENSSNKMPIWKHWKDGIAGNGEGKPIYLVKIGNTYSLNSCLGFECDYIELSELDNLMLEKQKSEEINVKALLTADRLAAAEMTGRLKERKDIVENPQKYGLEKQGTSYTKRDVDDAFIEKAWDWIEDNMLSSNQQDKSLLYYEQFKKYLEE